MRSLLLAAVVLASSAISGTASPLDNMPAHLRGGDIFQELLKKESKSGHTDANGQHIQLRSGATWAPNRTINYFDQWIDHDDHSKGTFRQRYWIDMSNYTDNVAMLSIGGEGPASSSPNGFAGQYGLSMGAAMFTLEHRYYGESYPASLLDQSTLRTLTVENALADLAGFRDWVQGNLLRKEKTVWFCVGGSYPGALSTWLRMTYPTKFDAAWASSGVVYARFDFYDFDTAIIRVLPPTCADAIRNVFSLWEELWETDREKALAIFGTPSYFTKGDMAWMMADGSAMAVQYGRKYEMCTIITPKSDNPLQVYADYIKKVWGNGFVSNCYYSTECLSNPSFEPTWGPGTYCWVFQTCYQFAFWQSGYAGSLRPEHILNTSYYMEQCRTAWWPSILPNTYQMNRKYGGLKPNIDKVIATQGSDDPWLYAGIQVSPGPNYPVSLAQCDNCGHCGDLHAPSAADPLSLQESRVHIAGNLTQWIREAQGN